MLLKFSELLHHMDGASQGDLIGRDFYAKMDFLNWQGLSRCTYHAYRIRKDSKSEAKQHYLTGGF